MRGKVKREKRELKNVLKELSCFAIEILKTRKFYVTIMIQTRVEKKYWTRNKGVTRSESVIVANGFIN